MTLELRPEMTASPEDLFGPKGEIFKAFSGVERLLRVADNIDEVRPEVEARGLLLIELWRSSWVVYRKGQTLEESELSFFTDRVDEFVWISETEVEKFQKLFNKEE